MFTFSFLLLFLLFSFPCIFPQVLWTKHSLIDLRVQTNLPLGKDAKDEHCKICKISRAQLVVLLEWWCIGRETTAWVPTALPNSLKGFVVYCRIVEYSNGVLQSGGYGVLKETCYVEIEPWTIDDFVKYFSREKTWQWTA